MHVILEILCSLLLSLLLLSCSDSKQGASTPDADNHKTQMGADVSTEPEQFFISEDRTEKEIMADYDKPLRFYPTISSAESKTGKDGLLYRDGLEVPFTGRLMERFEDGSVSMEAAYWDGLPHGLQIRRFPDGSPALEAIFDHGILSGIKTKWWGQGIIREEEYWSEGQYRGRRLWDQDGRLLREEIVPGS